MSVKISIITPSFNQAKFLEETIRSVVSQRDQIHEYFVLDGGSTDGSVEIIRKYADKIDWWVSEKDKGQSDAIHRGFTRATGDIIAWLNSDDVYFPGTLARVREAFDAHPDWDVSTGYSAWIDAQSRITRMWRIPGESAAWARWGVTHVCQQTCFFKRDLYQKVGGVNLDLHCIMDTELWFRFFDAGARWGHIPEYLAGFRIHEGSKGVSWKKKYAEENQWAWKHCPAYSGPTIKHHAGQRCYQVTQLLSPERLRQTIHTRTYAGRNIETGFGTGDVR